MPLTPTIDYSKSVPDFWTEEDKIDYDILRVEAKKIYPNMEEFIIHIGILAYINERKGLKVQSSNEEIMKEMERYKCKDLVYETPYDPDFRIEDTFVNKIEGSLVKHDPKESVLNNNLTNIIEEDNEI